MFFKCRRFSNYEFDGTTIHVVDYLDNETPMVATLPELLKGLEVAEIFTINMEETLLDQFKALDIKVILELKGEIAETVVGYHLAEILENKKRGMMPLSSCHSTCGSEK